MVAIQPERGRRKRLDGLRQFHQRPLSNATNGTNGTDYKREILYVGGYLANGSITVFQFFPAIGGDHFRFRHFTVGPGDNRNQPEKLLWESNQVPPIASKRAFSPARSISGVYKPGLYAYSDGNKRRPGDINVQVVPV